MERRPPRQGARGGGVDSNPAHLPPVCSHDYFFILRQCFAMCNQLLGKCPFAKPFFRMTAPPRNDTFSSPNAPPAFHA